MKDSILLFMSWYGCGILLNKLIYFTVLRKLRERREISDTTVFLIALIGTIIRTIEGYV